ncbi:hypothetical protein D3875_19700 [Deinococcus cavernae]|uniref:Uncharacterized protein n=1 Tax=Deinococcus cavernae TaxID=2320857 RepID=A0A418VBA9_9DEIO|nr:hypothetical protein [Deinococcus cavernae]RJF73434.1 hypothetical protein D3875_19700 [Deinococcus cavernae]
MTDNRYGNTPLGKSVEEVQDEAGNRINSPVEGEAVRANDEKLIPAVVNSNASGTPVGVLHPEALVEAGGSGDDGSARTNRDSSQE